MVKINTPVMLINILLAFTLVSCGGGGGGGGGGGESGSTTNTSSTSGNTADTSDTVTVLDTEPDYFIDVVHHEEGGDYIWNAADEILIDLLGNSATSSDSSVVIENSLIQISSGGTYRLTGPLYDGQIFINSADDSVVRLILDNANLTSTTSAPIFIEESYKTILILEDGTTNSIFDPIVYVFDDDAEEDEPNAAIFSKDNLTIYGAGSLTVDAHYNDGIASKDGLLIKSGSITINAEDDGIRGKDYLVIENGNFMITSNGDGLKSTKEEVDFGYTSISSGTFSITSASGDAITAESNIQIAGGNFSLSSGGGSNVFPGEASTKGLKAGQNIFIEGGILTVDSSDDAIHSNNGVTIIDGSFSISSSDDGVHADSTLVIDDGDINIAKSYEGIESAEIIINGGDIYLESSDDGINVAGGADGSGGNGFAVNNNNTLDITGGYIVIDAEGDGLDSNGHITMTAGTVIVHGPTANFNGSLDFNGAFLMNGGLLVAAGSARMAETPSTGSDQFSYEVNINLSANTLFHVQDSQGNSVLTFQPVKSVQSIVLSSPQFNSNDEYSIYTSGSSTGYNNGGLYSRGVYTPGNFLLKFAFSDSGVVTEFN